MVRNAGPKTSSTDNSEQESLTALTGGVDVGNNVRAVGNDGNGFDAETVRINGKDQVAFNAQ